MDVDFRQGTAWLIWQLRRRRRMRELAGINGSSIVELGRSPGRCGSSQPISFADDLSQVCGRILLDLKNIGEEVRTNRREEERIRSQREIWTVKIRRSWKRTD